MRGNLLTRDISAIRIGSIPACAGEPGASPGHLERGAVYPRVCGGTNKTNRATIPISGLSPRVRGNLPSRRRDRRPRGSIPACAGEPSSLSASSAFIRVYPRVCGGTGFIYHLSFEPVGLSPRVRGNQAQRRKAASECRSIPACAGEPVAPEFSSGWERVYPRVCGGTPVIMWEARGGYGLSPRVRGNLSRAVANSDSRGLSPRVRGNHILLRTGGAQQGSIPACAGEPAFAKGAPVVIPVYPRVCGGTSQGLPYRHHIAGLSPRVRGNHVPP